MADHDEVEQALLDAIAAAAGAAKAQAERGAPGPPRYYAQAARDLAEAFAWLNSPGQPHGGSGSIGD